MNLDIYPSNQVKKKPDTEVPNKREKKESVVQNSGKKAKKSYMRKIFDAFFETEEIPDKKNHIIFNVLIPSTKRMILSSIESFFGVSSGTISNVFGGNGTRIVKTNVPYSKISQTASDKRATYEYNDIVFSNMADAESVLMAMIEQLNDYGIASVLDYYEFCGESGTNTDNNWGWTNLDRARIEHCSDGYILRLPKVLPLN